MASASSLFTQELIGYAQEVQKLYGVYASCCLAAAFCETTCGTAGTIFKHTNNYFNIKKGSSWTGPVYTTSKGNKYRVYATKLDSFLDFGKLLTSPSYARLTAGTTNVFDYIDAYADRFAPRSDGNVNYAGHLKSTIRKYNLTQYDTTNRSVTTGSGLATSSLTAASTDSGVKVWHAESPRTIAKWGILRYFESVDNPSYGADKATKLLNLYNHKKRQIKVDGAFGDVGLTIRAGNLIPVRLDFGDFISNNYMLVEKVTHKFSNAGHTMDLTLEGWWED